MLHILTKHENSLFPTQAEARQEAIQDIMFANATMHPAYGRLFFLGQNVADEKIKQDTLDSAAESINSLWQVVENQLANKSFLGGDSPSAADNNAERLLSLGCIFPSRYNLWRKNHTNAGRRAGTVEF